MTHERPPLTEPDQDPEELTQEEIDAQAAESFPASDPPSFSATHAGRPAREEDLDEERREREDEIEEQRHGRN